MISKIKVRTCCGYNNFDYFTIFWSKTLIKTVILVHQVSLRAQFKAHFKLNLYQFTEFQNMNFHNK